MNVNSAYIVGSDSGTPSQSTPNLKRMSISLPADIVEMLEILTSHQGISQNEAIRKAIATEAYIYKERMQNSKILIQRSDGEIREVVFR